MTIKLKAHFSFRLTEKAEMTHSRGWNKNNLGWGEEYIILNVCEGMEKQKLPNYQWETTQVT